MELYKKYRPQDLSEVVGQSEAVNMLQDFLDKKRLPQVILMTGPSGVGKTSIARALCTQIECGDRDLKELNCAEDRGIDMVRLISRQIRLAPISGACRVWIMDEFHHATGEAQTALLKLLEDTPKRRYFFICTTHRQKVIPTIRNRATEIQLKEIIPNDLKKLICRIWPEESKTPIPAKVVDAIVSAADGSARKALVILDQVIGLGTEAEQLKAITAADAKTEAIQIARALLKGARWQEVAKILKTVEEDPEQIRYMVLSYMNSVLLGGAKNDRAFDILNQFEESFIYTGKAGLTRACYGVCPK